MLLNNPYGSKSESADENCTLLNALSTKLRPSIINWARYFKLPARIMQVI
jgi:hypothetical protein